MAKKPDGNPPRKMPVHGADDESAVWLPVEQDDGPPAKPQLEVLDYTKTPVDRDTPSTWSFRRLGLARRMAMRAAMTRDRYADGLAVLLRLEADRGAAFLWVPVLFGLGIALYFALPREPLLWSYPALALIALGVWLRLGRGSSFGAVAAAIVLVASGLSVAQWHVRLTSTIMLPGPVLVNLQGVVEKAEHRLNGSRRYTISLDGPAAQWTSRDSDVVPATVRLTARKGGPDLAVGEMIAGLARVGPPSGPAFPGAYDFSFQLWFDGIGGNGFFLGPPKKVENDTQPSFSLARGINAMRAGIASIIRAVLPGENGALATALIVGDRSGIPEDTAEALRRSGLAHILAISGLHMALVAATVLFALRGLGAAVPRLALHYPVKKWASGGALAATAGYLLISGGSVSTQRAFIMIAIMLLAVMMDRRALTMRNVAIAALVVLVLAPEALLSPGFQMSFAAVAGLVAAYEQAASWRSRRDSQPGIAGQKQRLVRTIIRNISGLALTSLIAGIATGLFAAYHFHRIAPLGLVANVFAMPLVSIMVMPAALASILAMPFALEAVPLRFMAAGVEWVTGVASTVSDWSAGGDIGTIPRTTLWFGTSGLLIACLSRTKLKLAAVPFIVLAVVMGTQRTTPDVLVLENANQIGVLADGKPLQLLKSNAEKFTTRIWRQAYRPGAEKPPAAKRGASDFRCDDFGCTYTIKGLTIAHIRNTARLYEDCRMADILVIPYAMPEACGENGSIILDRTALARDGARALYIRGDKAVQTPKLRSPQAGAEPEQPAVEIVSAIKNHRPWTSHRLVTGR